MFENLNFNPTQKIQRDLGVKDTQENASEEASKISEQEKNIQEVFKLNPELEVVVREASGGDVDYKNIVIELGRSKDSEALGRVQNINVYYKGKLIIEEFKQYIEKNEISVPQKINERFTLEGILNQEQIRLLETENQIKKFNLSPEGKILFGSIAQAHEEEEKIKEWKTKDGVIDASVFNETTVIVFNSEIKIPEGCRDLKNIKGHTGLGRAGEYDPEKDDCFVDISNTYSFLEDKYRADWETQMVRHELRHALVNHTDIDYSKKNDVSGKRNADFTLINKEELMQLAYLDELHSVYFDVLEGKESETKLSDIQSDFYSTVKEGTHLEVVGDSDKSKNALKELFPILQKLISLKKNDNLEFTDKIEKASIGVGVILATERTISDVLEKTKKILDMLLVNTIN